MHAPARACTPRRSRPVDRTPRCRTRRRQRWARRWPDRLGGTRVGDAPDMAPIATPIRPPVTRLRTRSRREPRPLDQLPAWRDLVPVMDPTLTAVPEDPGLQALLGGLNPDQLRAVTH